jgi:hypothetical protein
MHNRSTKIPSFDEGLRSRTAKVVHPGLNSEEQAQEEIEPANPFPLACLPQALKQMAEAISASVDVPLELSGPLVLGVASGAIGKGLQLSSGADRVIRGNLYMLGIAESGTGKSSAIKLAAAPIQAREKNDYVFWEEVTKPETKADLRVLKREIETIEKQLGGKKKSESVDRAKLREQLTEKIAQQESLQKQLEPPRMIVEDVTQEALGGLLSRNNE